MKCEETECGYTKGGLRVRAITDSAGSQVVVTDDESPGGTHLLSKPLRHHKACVLLGLAVQSKGIDSYDEWQSPMGLFELVCLSVESGVNECSS